MARAVDSLGDFADLSNYLARIHNRGVSITKP